MTRLKKTKTLLRQALQETIKHLQEEAVEEIPIDAAIFNLPYQIAEIIEIIEREIDM